MADKLDAYLNTIDRMEPEIAMIDDEAFYASAAISLKRIADAMTKPMPKTIGLYLHDDGSHHVLTQVNDHDSKNVYRGQVGEVTIEYD